MNLAEYKAKQGFNLPKYLYNTHSSKPTFGDMGAIYWGLILTTEDKLNQH